MRGYTVERITNSAERMEKGGEKVGCVRNVP